MSNSQTISNFFKQLQTLKQTFATEVFVVKKLPGKQNLILPRAIISMLFRIIASWELEENRW